MNLEQCKGCEELCSIALIEDEEFNDPCCYKTGLPITHIISCTEKEETYAK